MVCITGDCESITGSIHYNFFLDILCTCFQAPFSSLWRGCVNKYASLGVLEHYRKTKNKSSETFFQMKFLRKKVGRHREFTERFIQIFQRKTYTFAILNKYFCLGFFNSSEVLQVRTGWTMTIQFCEKTSDGKICHSSTMKLFQVIFVLK